MAEYKNKARLVLRVRQSVTVLPRCLQNLSRRGYIVLELSTKTVDATTAKLTMTIEGEQRWHSALPHLLSRLVDVEDVTVEEL
ncbi:MAG: hypothetical protein JWP13_571 [Candidatus Saccharibacteria bacterium]|nr:hypothetical protein [Candidatus Saccharibacteria bacterium]